MKKYCRSILILALSLTSPAVFASKVDVVMLSLKRECRKEVSFEEALVYVRALYLTCIPETTVHVLEACSLKCLRPNASSALTSK